MTLTRHSSKTTNRPVENLSPGPPTVSLPTKPVVAMPGSEKVADSSQLQCHLCKKSYLTVDSMSKHLANFHKIKESAFVQPKPDDTEVSAFFPQFTSTENSVENQTPEEATNADNSSSVVAAENEGDNMEVISLLSVTKNVSKKLLTDHKRAFELDTFWKKFKYTIPPIPIPADRPTAVDELLEMTDKYAKEEGGFLGATAKTYSMKHKQASKTLLNLFPVVTQLLRTCAEMHSAIVLYDRKIIGLRGMIVNQANELESLKSKTNELIQFVNDNYDNPPIHDDIPNDDQPVVEAGTADSQSPTPDPPHVDHQAETNIDLFTQLDDLNTKLEQQRLYTDSVALAISTETNKGLKELYDTLKLKINSVSSSLSSAPSNDQIADIKAKENFSTQILTSHGAKLAELEHQLKVLSHQIQSQDQKQAQMQSVQNKQELNVMTVPSKIKIGNFIAKSVDGNEPFACNICKVPFTNTTDLQSHTTKHHRTEAEYPFKCPLCQFRSKTNEGVMSHSLIKHKEVRITVPSEDTDESKNVHLSVLVGGLTIPKTMKDPVTICNAEKAQILGRLRPLYAEITENHIKFYKRITDDDQPNNTGYFVQVGFHDQAMKDFILEGTESVPCEVYPFRTKSQIENSRNMVQSYGSFLENTPLPPEPDPSNVTQNALRGGRGGTVSGAGGRGRPRVLPFSHGRGGAAPLNVSSAADSTMETLPSNAMRPFTGTNVGTQLPPRRGAGFYRVRNRPGGRRGGRPRYTH